MIKKLMSIIGAALMVAAANAGPLPSDGRIDAFTKTNPGIQGGPVVYGTFTDLGNGYLLCAFQVTGIGRWACYEVCTGNQIRFLGSGIASPSGQIYTYVIAKSDYVDCFWNLTNVHGWAGPELQ